MKKILSIVTMVSVICLVCILTGKANAASGANATYFGRPAQYGYFTGQYTNAGNWLFVPTPRVQYDGLGPGCINDQCTVTLQSFLNVFHDRLTDPTSYVDRGRAAAVIDIMLGRPGTSFGSIQNGINYANSHYLEWERIIEIYASGADPGYSVQWNANINFGLPGFNVDGLGWSGAQSPDYTTCSGQQCIGDVIFKILNDNTFDHAVVFAYPGGAFYIKHKCGNLTGDIKGLPVPPQPQPPTCSITFSKSSIDPFTTFSVSPEFTFSNYSKAISTQFSGAQVVVEVNGPLPSSKYRFGPNILHPPPSNGDTITAVSALIGPVNSPGSYQVTYSLRDVFGVIKSCSQTFTIAYLPYFNVVGGDSVAGSGMIIGCSGDAKTCDIPPNTYGGIVSWARGSNGVYAGAGDQYAAFVLAYIQAFATGQGNNILGQTTTPYLLAFANTGIGALPAEVFGGKFGAELPIPDYFNLHPANATQAPGVITTIPAGTHVVYINGNETINLSGALGDVPNGSNTIIFVNGNVTIDNNIRFSHSYQDIAAIPYLRIVAKGNIYIKPTVAELDGIYIAEPDVNLITRTVSSGEIFTCTTVPPFVSQSGDPNLTINNHGYYSTCNRHLDVYGAFVARKVKLLRTYGSLYEVPASPAETFHYDPESWLAGGSANESAYNTITELPPVL